MPLRKRALGALGVLALAAAFTSVGYSSREGPGVLMCPEAVSSVPK